MVKSLSLFLGIVVCSSCGYNTVPKHVKQNFTYCYDGIDTGIDTLLNIEGYYDFLNEDYCSSCYMCVMFYKDGTYVASPTYPRDEGMQTYFEKTVNDTKSLYRFHKYREWGRYIIQGDTIKLQTIDRPVWGSTSVIWWMDEIWYKIIDRNTIIGIYPSKKPVRYPEDLKEESYMRRYGVPAKFTPVSVQPSSDCWLKEEKWFWCDEEDWKAYMEGLKQQ